MEATVSVSGLRKRFGTVTALDGMSFTVPPGQVTGFVGPNGAGKSTTMRVIVGLDAADAGSALIGGRPYVSLAAEQVVAVLGAHAVPFAEVSAHRVSLEEAYMELTRDAVEYRAASASVGRGTT